MLAAGLIAGGALIGAYGQMKAGKSARAYARMQADFLRQKQKEIMLRNEMNNKLVWRETSLLLGEQRAATAGSGVDVGSMSALELASETTKLAAEQIGRQTREAQYEASMAGAEAQMSIFSGDASYKAAKWSALGTLLGGAGDLYATGAMPQGTTDYGVTHKRNSYSSSPNARMA